MGTSIPVVLSNQTNDKNQNNKWFRLILLHFGDILNISDGVGNIKNCFLDKIPPWIWRFIW